MRFSQLISVTLLGLSMQTVPGEPAPQNANMANNPYRTIEAHSRISNVNNPESIRLLASDVLALPHVLKLPQPAEDLVKVRLSDAEIAYRNKQIPGVREEQIVELLNNLAVRFKLPAYSRTTEVQVRHLRMKLLVQSPSFMTAGIVFHNRTKGESLSSEMSPLQAFHLLDVMVDQKVLNPDYQDPNLDLNAVESERLRTSQAMIGAGTGGSRLAISTNYKRVEMRAAIDSATQRISVSDVMSTVTQALLMFNF